MKIVPGRLALAVRAGARYGKYAVEEAEGRRLGTAVLQERTDAGFGHKGDFSSSDLHEVRRQLVEEGRMPSWEHMS